MSKKTLDDMPFTTLFLTTKDQSESNNALSWLSTLDLKTLKELQNYSKKLDSDELQEEDLSDDILDFMGLSWAISCFENNIDTNYIDNEEHTKATIGLMLLVDFEIMRRNGLVIVEGSGKISSMDDTRVILTEQGVIVQDGLNTVDKIVDKIVENEKLK
jgi:hypothetical protein